jgi:hypothetical protein
MCICIFIKKKSKNFVINRFLNIFFYLQKVYFLPRQSIVEAGRDTLHWVVGPFGAGEAFGWIFIAASRQFFLSPILVVQRTPQTKAQPADGLGLGHRRRRQWAVVAGQLVDDQVVGDVRFQAAPNLWGFDRNLDENQWKLSVLRDFF